MLILVILLSSLKMLICENLVIPVRKTKRSIGSQSFKGLAIEKLEKDWTEYPVLHFSMAGGKHMEKDQLERYLGNRLAEQEKVWVH